MAEHIREEFNISVTPAAIQKTLKTVNITWKTVTQIPCKWNEAAFLQQEHDYVMNRVTNVGQKLILIDESGFNSQTHPSHGYSLSVKLFLNFFFFFFKSFFFLIVFSFFLIVFHCRPCSGLKNKR